MEHAATLTRKADMSGSPVFKIYDAGGIYQASAKEIEAAAAVVSLYGEGSRIRYTHSHVVWVEGQDGRASDSYDSTSRIVWDRIMAMQKRQYAKSCIQTGTQKVTT